MTPWSVAQTMAGEATPRTGIALDANRAWCPARSPARVLHESAACRRRRSAHRVADRARRRSVSIAKRGSAITSQQRLRSSRAITVSERPCCLPSWRSAEWVRHRRPGMVRSSVPIRLVAVYSTRNWRMLLLAAARAAQESRAARPKRARPCDAKTSCDGHSKDW